MSEFKDADSILRNIEIDQDIEKMSFWRRTTKLLACI